MKKKNKSRLFEERELNPKIKEKAGKAVGVVKGIDASKVMTTIVGGVAVEMIKSQIKKD